MKEDKGSKAQKLQKLSPLIYFIHNNSDKIPIQKKMGCSNSCVKEIEDEKKNLKKLEKK